MKHTLLFCLLFICQSSFSQNVDGLELDKMDNIKYIKVRLFDAGKFGKILYRASIDYGLIPEGKATFQVKDSSGEFMLWKSDMEMVNFFANYGWKLLYERSGTMIGITGTVPEFVFSKN
jgi:hypothetical protein